MERHRSLGRPAAIANFDQVTRSIRFPHRLLVRGTQGIVQARLIVDEDGGAQSCTIKQSTRPREFDELVCAELMRLAGIEPALDDEGQPLKSYVRTTVRFVIE